MRDCHRDIIIDSMLDQAVTVTLKNGKKYSGLLKLVDFGYGYIVECFNEPYNVKFTKSQLKVLESYEKWGGRMKKIVLITVVLILSILQMVIGAIFLTNLVNLDCRKTINLKIEEVSDNNLNNK